MDTIQWLTGSGLVFSVLVPVLGYVLKHLRANDKGVQALLRDRLIQCYNYYQDKGYAPIYARENFENMWEQYHKLGGNGAISNLHDRFMELPTEKEIKNEH